MCIFSYFPTLYPLLPTIFPTPTIGRREKESEELYFMPYISLWYKFGKKSQRWINWSCPIFTFFSPKFKKYKYVLIFIKRIWSKSGIRSLRVLSYYWRQSFIPFYIFAYKKISETVHFRYYQSIQVQKRWLFDYKVIKQKFGQIAL